MGSFLLISKVLKNALIWYVFVASMTAVLVASFQFEVGREKGWVKPTGNETETYNEWATENRFHIGDTIYFKYTHDEDSVLVVNSSDYENCSGSNPIYEFRDGNTVFQFGRSGFFYFISGQPGHCKSGQKLIIRVMHPSEVEVEVEAPEAGSPTTDGWDSHNLGPPALNSTSKLSVTSYFITFLGCVLVILYWLM